MDQSAIQRAVGSFDGSPSKLARAMGASVKRQNVEHWLRTGSVPVEHCAALELATEGVVKRWELRPLDWHRIWPDLIGIEGAPHFDDEEVSNAA